MEYKKSISFGKVAYDRKQKYNEVIVELCLKHEYGTRKIVFTAQAEVWNRKKTDCYMGGQCLDTIWEDYAKQIENPTLYKGILELWQKWHLNDMHAECQHQEKLGYSWLKNAHDKCKVCGWVLGHGWSYRAIDTADLKRICELMEIDYQTARTLQQINARNK